MDKNLIYWENFDEPHIVFDAVLQKEVEVKGCWKCDHPRVKNAIRYGSITYPLTKDSRSFEVIELFMDDGNRFRHVMQSENDFEEAEKWLEENNYNKTNG